MTIQELIDKAFEVARPMKWNEDFSAATVGCALETAEGNLYTGICIDLASGLGFCAEASAIAEMLKNQQRQIKKIVAVNSENIILPPCGRCREMMAQVSKENFETQVIITPDRTVPLKELLPNHWLY